MTPFAELAVTTNFSFLRGGSHPEELVKEAARLGLAGIAVADRNTLAGVVRGHVAAKELGLTASGFRYVVGCRLVFRDGTPDILAWPADRAAYGRLCRLLTLGNRRAPKGECHLDLADLLEWGEGMMLGVMPGHGLSAAPPSIHPLVPAHAGTQAPRGSNLDNLDSRVRGNERLERGLRPQYGPDRTGERDNDNAALASPLTHTLATLCDAFPGSVRLMASRLYGPADHRRLAALDRIARRFAVPLMATNDVLYHVPERRPLQDVLTCIREHETLATAGRLLAANAERHVKDAAEMARLFRDHPEAVAESRAVLERLAADGLRPVCVMPTVPSVGQHDPAVIERLRARAEQRRPG